MYTKYFIGLAPLAVNSSRGQSCRLYNASNMAHFSVGRDFTLKHQQWAGINYPLKKSVSENVGKHTNYVCLIRLNFVTEFYLRVAANNLVDMYILLCFDHDCDES